LKNLKVLLVEDEQEAANLLLKYLQKKFNNVYVANDGEEAYNLYTEFNPNIILTDINMPKMDGLELVEKIREKDKKTRIILITAFNEQSNISKAVQLDLDDFLIKPINLEALKQALDQACEKYLINHVLLNDGFYWDINTKTLYNQNNESIKLSKNERKLLTLLCINKKIFFTKHEISEYLYEDYNKLNSVRTIFSRLRLKISGDIIESIFDKGYKIKSM
jgi:DNA-binding response OmpR family regulator